MPIAYSIDVQTFYLIPYGRIWYYKIQYKIRTITMKHEQLKCSQYLITNDSSIKAI